MEKITNKLLEFCTEHEYILHVHRIYETNAGYKYGWYKIADGITGETYSISMHYNITSDMSAVLNMLDTKLLLCKNYFIDAIIRKRAKAYGISLSIFRKILSLNVEHKDILNFRNAYIKYNIPYNILYTMYTKNINISSVHEMCMYLLKNKKEDLIRKGTLALQEGCPYNILLDIQNGMYLKN